MLPSNACCNLRSKVLKAPVSAKDVRLSESHGVTHGTNASAQQVLDILSEPVKTAVYNYDIVADEMAEMIAKHTFSLNVDDSMNGTVASFKPVNLPNA
jgi:hypothetical protein